MKRTTKVAVRTNLSSYVVKLPVRGERFLPDPPPTRCCGFQLKRRGWGVIAHPPFRLHRHPQQRRVLVPDPTRSTTLRSRSGGFIRFRPPFHRRWRVHTIEHSRPPVPDTFHAPPRQGQVFGTPLHLVRLHQLDGTSKHLTSDRALQVVSRRISRSRVPFSTRNEGVFK